MSCILLCSSKHPRPGSSVCTGIEFALYACGLSYELVPGCCAGFVGCVVTKLCYPEGIYAWLAHGFADTVHVQGRAHPGLSYSNAVGGGGYEAASNGGSINPTPVSGSSPYASASSNGGPANGGSAYSSGRCGVLVIILSCLPCEAV